MKYSVKPTSGHTCVVMFADLSDGSDPGAYVSDTLSVDVVIEALTMLRSVIGSNRGRFVKSVGDELLCLFPSPVSALLAASQMQVQLAALADTGHKRNGLQLRVGLHWGAVLDEGDDVFGDAVNTTARVLSECRSNQILATEELIDNLPPEFTRATRFVDDVLLRGKCAPRPIFEIILEGGDATELGAPKNCPPRIKHSILILEHLGHQVQVSAAYPLVHVGRGKDADIRCVGGLISRDHLRIEYQRQRFLLTDVSANGTYVLSQGQASPVKLRRECMSVNAGHGTIGLGRAPVASRSDDIHYNCY